MAAHSVEDPTQFDVVLIDIPTVSITPPQIQLAPGQTRQFTARVLLTDQRVIWTATGGNTIDPLTGLFTAGQNPGTFEVKATSVADPSKSDTATVTVAANVRITISPNSVELAPDQTQQFSSTVTGLTNQEVTWTASGDTIDRDTGLFTAGADLGTFQVTATSVADSTVRASTTVTVAGLRLGNYVSFRSIGSLLNGTRVESIDTTNHWTLQISAPLVPSSGSFRFTVTRDGSFTATSDDVRIEATVGKFASGNSTGNGIYMELNFASGFGHPILFLRPVNDPLPQGQQTDQPDLPAVCTPFEWEIRLLFAGP